MAMKRKLLIALAIVLAFASFAGCKKQEAKEVEVEQKLEEAKGEEPNVEVDLVLTDVSYLEELEKKAIELPFELTEITPQIPGYTIAADLSNVKNIKYFGDFTDAQKEALVKNGFVITKTGMSEWNEGEYRYDQIHQIYEDNEYKMIPSFVTTDSMTHIFHIFYDGFLRGIEEDELYPKSIEMTEKLLKSNIDIYNELKDEMLKDLQIKNIAFFGVAAELLGAEMKDIPAEARALINEELTNVKNLTWAKSVISGGDLDYSQLTPRGHYTRSEELKKYFQSTMYYGQLGLFPFDEGIINEKGILQALLITHSAYVDPEIFKLWSALVDPIDFLVETADDLSLREYGKILYSVYGKEPDLNKLANRAELEKVAELITKLPTPLITPYQGQSFRFIPQRAVFDNVLMQNVVDIKVAMNPSKRPIYSGLDLMVAFGNEKAKEIQYAEEYNSYWDLYEERTENNISLVKSLSDKHWQKNLYRGWLWMLTSYKNTYGEGYPFFMQNEAWQKKDLVSALGSYAELKHDTVLYGKQVGAEMGGFFPDEYPKGYVEPNLELYEKLSWLLEYTKINLKDRDMLSQEYEDRLDNFKNLVDKVKALAIKELKGEAFTASDYEELNYIGGEMESVAVSFVQGDGGSLGNWYEIESATDRRMPVIVDLMEVVDNVANIPAGKYLSIGTGKPAEIYVIYPQDGELHMGRGGIFTYYEILADERLTDERWQERLLEEEVEVPKWYQDIIFEEKPAFEGNIDYDW